MLVTISNSNYNVLLFILPKELKLDLYFARLCTHLLKVEEKSPETEKPAEVAEKNLPKPDESKPAPEEPPKPELKKEKSTGWLAEGPPSPKVKNDSPHF